MNICPECDLPMKVCNALATYRMAADYLTRGRRKEAEDSLAAANDWYQAYMKERADSSLTKDSKP